MAVAIVKDLAQATSLRAGRVGRAFERTLPTVACRGIGAPHDPP